MSNIYKRLPTDIQENIDKQIYESNCDTRESLIDDLNSYVYMKSWKYSQNPYNVEWVTLLIPNEADMYSW